MGLRWQDIDFKAGIIYKRNVVYRGELLVGLKNTKKKDGKPREHKIVMPALLASVLKQHFETTLYKEAEHFVFCREDGSPLDPDHMRNYVLYPAMDKAKIDRQKRGFGLHMFRHLAGSVVYAVTGDIKKAQEQLGHSDLQTTSNIYVHSNLTQKQEAAKALELTFAADLLPTLLPEKTI